MAEIVRKVLPQAKAVATIVNPSEVNSTYFRDLLAEAMGKVGIEVRSFAADRPADVSVAADTMASSGIDAIVQISDSLSGSAFPAIAAAAKRANVPLFGFNSDQAERGCVLVVARDFIDMGREAGKLAKRILDGADPATIPFQEPIGSRLIVNEEVAKALGITIPPEVLSEADRRIPTP
jgi:putative ABC transport system substrate-binding protein